MQPCALLADAVEEKDRWKEVAYALAQHLVDIDPVSAEIHLEAEDHILYAERYIADQRYQRRSAEKPQVVQRG